MVQVLIVMLLAVPLMGMFPTRKVVAAPGVTDVLQGTFTPPEDGAPGRRDGGGTR